MKEKRHWKEIKTAMIEKQYRRSLKRAKWNSQTSGENKEGMREGRKEVNMLSKIKVWKVAEEKWENKYGDIQERNARIQTGLEEGRGRWGRVCTEVRICFENIQRE